jgi:hypothetical protein
MRSRTLLLAGLAALVVGLAGCGASIALATAFAATMLMPIAAHNRQGLSVPCGRPDTYMHMCRLRPD